MPKIQITPHAIERYVSRHAPGMPEREAERVLNDAADKAVCMRGMTRDKRLQYRIEELGIVMVVKRCKRDGLVCLTVLPHTNLGEGRWRNSRVSSDAWLEESLLKLAGETEREGR